MPVGFEYTGAFGPGARKFLDAVVRATSEHTARRGWAATSSSDQARDDALWRSIKQRIYQQVALQLQAAVAAQIWNLGTNSTSRHAGRRDAYFAQETLDDYLMDSPSIAPATAGGGHH